MPTERVKIDPKDTSVWNFRIQEINKRFLKFPDRKVRPQTYDQKLEYCMFK